MLRIENPLPQRFATDTPGIGGVIKARPQDFIVEELPLYEPCGQGEHLYLGIEKTGVSHAEMMSCLRRHFGVRDGRIGFAGMKDKAAVTRQAVSIHLPDGDPPGRPLEHERIRILWAMRHTNKIRLGHLAGNRFSIRIREVDPVKVTVAHQLLRKIERTGVTNYFGLQRFGYRNNNHRLGLSVLRNDWAGVLSELLGCAGPPFPEYQRARRELFDQRRYEDAAAQWTPSDRNELTIIRALCSGREPEDAVRTVGRSAFSFWISALQSAVFNRVVDHRIDAGTLATLVEGDLAWKHGTGSVFAVTAAELAGDELARRLEAFEISPSGPLWGTGMTLTAGETTAVEAEALDAMGIASDRLPTGQRYFKGARRSLRVPVGSAATESGVDEHGGYIRLAFDLPRGAYATVLLRELMKKDGKAMLAEKP